MERLPERVDRATFRRLFETFEHTAWRLETRHGYASDTAEVVRYAMARDAAMHHAIPRDQFAAQVATTE